VVTPELMDKLRAAYDHWHQTRGAGFSAWIDLMADDFVLRSIGDGAPAMEFSALRRGKEAVHGYFSSLAADWEMIHFTHEDFVVDGDQVVAFGNCAYRHRKTGKVAESPTIHRWRFRDGLAVELFEYYDTAKAFAAAIPDPK